MEIVTIDLAFEAQADHIRSRPERITPVPVNPRAGDIKAERRSKKTEKRPIESVIDNIAAVDWTFKGFEVWHDGFVGHGRIIKRERARKEAVASDSMGVCGMNSAHDYHRH